MTGRDPLWRRYLRLFGPNPRADVDDELRFHLEELERQHRAAGLLPEAARQAALAQFGDLEPTRRALHRHSDHRQRRDERAARWNGLRDDVRLGFRKLRLQPKFAIAAIATLALGLGANTAVFSVVNSVLLRPLGYRQPEQLYLIREVVPEMTAMYPTLPANLPTFRRWQAEVGAFEQIAVAKPRSLVLTGQGEATLLSGARVSANLFATLGVAPRLGRAFLTDEDMPGRHHVVIVTDGAWRQRFHADPAIVGQAIVLGGEPHIVVGVLPATFRFPKQEQFGPLTQFGAAVDFFTPLGLDAATISPLGDFDFAAIGRLKAGATPAQALAELNVVQQRIARDANQRLTLSAQLWPLNDQIVGSARTGLLYLMGGVGAVLLMVCVNLANLLLARVPGRLREAAIRTALGATRPRLMRQMLVETLLIAVLGGVLGLAVTWAGLRSLLALAPADLPRLDEVRIDARVLLFAFGASLGTGLLFGVFPAWRVGRAGPLAALKGGETRVSESGGVRRLRQSLIALEVAVSTLLLITGGLLAASLWRVLDTERGFAAEQLLAVDVTMSPAAYPSAGEREALFERLLAELRAVPGVRTAAWISQLPLTGESSVSAISVPGRPVSEVAPMANYRLASREYFAALGIGVRTGRLFEESDRSRPGVILSRSAAERLWPGENPVGRLVRTTWGNETDQEVIGVVEDVRSIRLDAPATVMIYLPPWAPQLKYRTAGSVVLRTSVPPASLAPEIRRVVRAIAPGVPITALRPMTDVVENSVAGRRFQVSLAVAFSASALLLAALGVFGVVTYAVEQRRRELGIRLALGARPGALRWLVVRQGMAPVVLGVIAGVIGALLTGRFIGSLLFGVDATDARTVAGVALVVVATAVVACYIPGTRATKIDPMTAWRAD